ncbi:hypothetical protein TeGR_g5717, partial [Tetraparma gracilis]
PNSNDACNGMLDKTDAAGSNKAVLVMLTKTRSSSGDSDQVCGHEEASAENEELGEQVRGRGEYVSFGEPGAAALFVDRCRHGGSTSFIRVQNRKIDVDLKLKLV